MLKSSLTITTSVFLFMSAAADLFAMELLEPLDNLDGKPGKQLVIAMTEDAEPGPINSIVKDCMELILEETSKDVNPRCLTSVCKSWRGLFGLKEILGGELHYSHMSPFMQTCMHTYWEKQFYNGILQYTPEEDQYNRVSFRIPDKATLKFSDLNKEGTFDFSACGILNRTCVVTKSMDRFFKIGEENQGKSVTLIVLRHRIQQEIKSSPDHRFASLMAGWDADKSPVGLFWRGGNDKDLNRHHYHATMSMSEVSSRNLYQHWLNVVSNRGEEEYPMYTRMDIGNSRADEQDQLHVSFKPK